MATLSVLGTWWLDETDYVEALYLQHFFAEPRQGIAHLVTLTYVPNYFDILPMYIVVLAHGAGGDGAGAARAGGGAGLLRSCSIWPRPRWAGTCRRNGGRIGAGSSTPSAGS